MVYKGSATLWFFGVLSRYRDESQSVVTPIFSLMVQFKITNLHFIGIAMKQISGEEFLSLFSKLCLKRESLSSGKQWSFEFKKKVITFYITYSHNCQFGPFILTLFQNRWILDKCLFSSLNDCKRILKWIFSSHISSSKPSSVGIILFNHWKGDILCTVNTQGNFIMAIKTINIKTFTTNPWICL